MTTACKGVPELSRNVIYKNRFLAGNVLKIRCLGGFAKNQALAPEAGALPGCATLRNREMPYRIGFFEAQALISLAQKREQNKHTAEGVPELSRNGFGRSGCVRA